LREELMDSFEFDEFRLLIFLKEICNEVSEYLIGEIFDLLGDFRDYLTMKEVYLILVYMAANESK
jgi:hypothetical protein